MEDERPSRMRPGDASKVACTWRGAPGGVLVMADLDGSAPVGAATEAERVARALVSLGACGDQA